MPDPATTFWVLRGAWAGIVLGGRYGSRPGAAGVTVDTLDRALATIVLGAGDRDALNATIRARFGFDLPETGRVAFGTAGDLVWSAPGQWLVVGRARRALDDLAEALAGAASVTDQTGSRGLLHVAGSHVRDVLAKGFAIDLHPSVFLPGTVAVTTAAQTSVQIWREDDAYVIAVARSFAGGFWAWLMDAASEVGCEVQD